MQRHFRIAAIGELLWDLLPEGPQLGGAPANFAAMSANLAAVAASPSVVSVSQRDEIFLVSCVGDDSLGRQALDELSAHGVRLEHISVDPQHATGNVTVALDTNKGPTYRIEKEVAWDYIPETPQLAALAPTLDVICFGTLAQRSQMTRRTLQRLVETTRSDCVRVFDVNLREPYWTSEELEWGCAHATILKMNDAEIQPLAQVLGPSLKSQTFLQIAHFLHAKFSIELIAITRGAKGSLLVTRETAHDHPGIAVGVVDLIGAGDAFTAALTYSVLHQLPLPVMAEAANRLGAWVASQRGGMPIMNESARHEWKKAVETVSSN